MKNMKKVVVELVHDALKRPILESLVGHAYRNAPRKVRPYVRKLAPQPYSYLDREQREAIRGGLRWELHPYAHFQWLQYFGFEDPVLEVLLVLAKRSETIFDVGANIGFYSLLMARAAGPRAQVHSFEPNPDTFSTLKRHRDLNAMQRVKLHSVALGAQEEDRTLFAGRDSGKFSLEAGDGRTLEGAKKVHVSTLDGYMAAEKIERLDLLKIDVEGHEPAVLTGARATIERCLPFLCFELTPAWYESDPQGAEASFGWLASLPYEFYRIASPEQPSPRLERTELLTELRRRGGPKQINLAAIASGKASAAEIVREVNAVTPGQPPLGA